MLWPHSTAWPDGMHSVPTRDASQALAFIRNSLHYAQASAKSCGAASQPSRAQSHGCAPPSCSLALLLAASCLRSSSDDMKNPPMASAVADPTAELRPLNASPTT